MQKADNEAQRIMVAEEKIAKTYAALEERQYPLVLRFFYKNVYDPTDAEDLAQETFIRIYRGLPKFKGEAKLDSWIHTIAVNCLINYYREQRRNNGRTVSLASMPHRDEYDSFRDSEEVVPSEERGPEQLVLSSELEEKLRRAANKLPLHMRDVFELQGFEGLSYEDTAAMLDIPLGTMKSRLNRARANLRSRLRGYVHS